MKKVLLIGMVMMGFSMRASAQEFEIEQLLLNVEKLAQFKQILQDMKDGYEILVQGYTTIRDLSEGNFSLHDAFLSGLMHVSPAVRKYKRIAEIIEMQVVLTRQCTGALRRFRLSELFSDPEISYLDNVYNNLLRSSLRNMEDLTTVITAGELRMSDHERLEMIDRIYADMTENISFVRYFTDGNAKLLIGRMRENKDVNILEKLLLDK
jgi:hypothetical protein